MDITVDPEFQRQFDAGLADYQARAERVGAKLHAEQQQIADRGRAADEKFAAERGQLLSKLKEEFKEPAGEEPPRRVGWHPVESEGRNDGGVMSFGSEPDESAPQRPRPTRPRRVRSEEDEDDYSQQTWMRD